MKLAKRPTPDRVGCGKHETRASKAPSQEQSCKGRSSNATSLETARPLLEMPKARSSGCCWQHHRRGDGKPPKAEGRAAPRVVLEEIWLQRLTTSGLSSDVDRQRAAGDGATGDRSMFRREGLEVVGGDQTLEGFQMADRYQTAGVWLQRARFD